MCNLLADPMVGADECKFRDQVRMVRMDASEAKGPVYVVHTRHHSSLIVCWQLESISCAPFIELATTRKR